MCGMTGMTWSEDDKWTSELTLTPGSYDFKLVILREDGSVAAWEPGENRTVTVSPFGLSDTAQSSYLLHYQSSYQDACQAQTRLPYLDVRRTRAWYCTHAIGHGQGSA